MAELGLNVFQVIQNELIQREGTRSTVGLGSRLTILEEHLKNSEAFAKNGLIWKLNHTVHAIASVTPEARLKIEKEREKLMTRKGANLEKDQKDPTMLPRHQEVWEIHRHFPKTVLEFKQLQFHPDRIRSLLEFYSIPVYRTDMRLINVDYENRCRDIQANLEGCMEELAISWGLNWQRIGGLSLPAPNIYLQNPPPTAPTPPRYSPFSGLNFSDSANPGSLPPRP